MRLYQHISGQNLGRLAALSDGIFAVAMTLLVLNIAIPTVGVAAHAQQPIWAPGALASEATVWNALVPLGPHLLTYLMSFLTLGIFWAGQQTFRRVRPHLTHGRAPRQIFRSARHSLTLSRHPERDASMSLGEILRRRRPSVPVQHLPRHRGPGFAAAELGDRASDRPAESVLTGEGLREGMLRQVGLAMPGRQPASSLTTKRGVE